ncbi:MAG: hypothetical protein V4497_09415 [Bacteroidota bacterium]
MKAEELRIGNWVDTGDFHLPRYKGNYKVKDEWFKWANKFKPIPLTEEWLLNFGFKKSNNATKFYTFDKDKLSIHLKSVHYNDGRTYFNSWCIMEKQIEYVHQLQNLFFCLCGEEITLSQPQ